MDERAIRDGLAQPEIGKEIVSREALKVLSERGGQRGFFGGAFAVGEAQGALFIADMH